MKLAHAEINEIIKDEGPFDAAIVSTSARRNKCLIEL